MGTAGHVLGRDLFRIVVQSEGGLGRGEVFLVAVWLLLWLLAAWWCG